jgi:hypothetical protein
MKKFAWSTLAFLILTTSPVGGQANGPASVKELEAITERGRELAEYDAAAWHATDAVKALNYDETKVRRYLARKAATGWTVVFGRLSEKTNQFLIAYEATAASSTAKFRTTEYDPPQEDTDFFFRAALATDTALSAFGYPNRPYNVAAIPVPQDKWWVYVVPAPTQNGVWPIGGDARFLISPDGMRILETRRLHKAIIESTVPTKAISGSHTHLLSDQPEDTDAFHVLTRKPQLPEYIITECCIYRVNTNGTINCVGPREDPAKKRLK